MCTVENVVCITIRLERIILCLRQPHTRSLGDMYVPPSKIQVQMRSIIYNEIIDNYLQDCIHTNTRRIMVHIATAHTPADRYIFNPAIARLWQWFWTWRRMMHFCVYTREIVCIYTIWGVIFKRPNNKQLNCDWILTGHTAEANYFRMHHHNAYTKGSSLIYDWTAWYVHSIITHKHMI